MIRVCPQQRMERWARSGGRGRQRARTSGTGGQSECVRVAPGAVPRARARPARAPRHLRAQVLQHPSAYGQPPHILTILLQRNFSCFITLVMNQQIDLLYANTAAWKQLQ